MATGLLASTGGSEIDFPLLTTLVVVPAVGAVALALLPRRRPELAQPIAVVFSMVAAALAAFMVVNFDTGDAGPQFVTNQTWIEEFGISWHLGVDGISLFLVALTALLFPIAMVGADPHHDAKPYYAWLLLLEAGCIGVFLALDLFLFFLFFEIVLVPMYFLIGGWGYGKRVYAAVKFFLFTMAGSALMLVAIVSLAFLSRDARQDAQQADAQTRQDEDAAAIQEEAQPLVEEYQELNAQIQATGQPTAQQEERIAELEAELTELQTQIEGMQAESAVDSETDLTFDLMVIAESPLEDNSSSANPLDWTAARWLFLAFAVAFAVKVPLFPLHTWLPDAHTEAPTAGSVILAGVLLKLGTYGMLRFGLFLFPGAASFFAPAMVTLGVIGILYGAIVATMQHDLKRLVAYSSVAHLGFIVLGTFAITTQGLQGSILQNINHGLSTGALFLLVGMIYERRQTREISALKGLQKVAPIFAAVFTLVVMSSIGLPGLNGFVGEFLILIGSFVTRRWWAVAAAVGVILAALYLLWAYQRVFHGEPDEENKRFPEITWREGFIMAPLLGLIVFLGIYPKPVLDRMEPSVNALICRVEAANGPTPEECAEDGSSDDELAGHDEGSGAEAEEPEENDE